MFKGSRRFNAVRISSWLGLVEIIDVTTVIEFFDETTVDEVFRLGALGFGVFFRQQIEGHLQAGQVGARTVRNRRQIFIDEPHTECLRN